MRDTEIVEIGGGSLSVNEDGGLDVKAWGDQGEDRVTVKLRYETADFKIEGEGENMGCLRCYTKVAGEWVPFNIVRADILLDVNKILPEVRVHMLPLIEMTDADE